MHSEELLTRYDHVLVALDGPVAVFTSVESMARRLRVMVAEGRLPRKVERTNDPVVVLAYAATIGPATERAVYAQLCRLEAEMAAAARVTPGVHEAFALLAAAGTHITVVGSLATASVRTFLVMHGLDEHVRHLVGRTGPDHTMLPPAPDLITAVIHERATPMESCLFIGSTGVDLTAARKAGVDTVSLVTSSAPELPVTPAADRWFEALTTER